MKVHLWSFGSRSDDWILEGERLYQKRIEHYLPFEYKCLQPSKSRHNEKLLSEEADWIADQLKQTPTLLILLDEQGQEYNTLQFATQLEKWRVAAVKRIVFLIGSAYGFDARVYAMAHSKLSLSKLTYPHQLCRLVMLEQLYRACTVIRGESYHHT